MRALGFGLHSAVVALAGHLALRIDVRMWLATSSQ
jgi:hypothetical protein